MQPHHIAIGVVKHEREEIEINNAMQAFRKVVKKGSQVPMLRDRFRHLEQSFELAPGMFKRRCRRWFGRGDSGIRHINQNSTRVGRGSTKGVMRKRMSSRPRARTVICLAPFVGEHVKESDMDN